MPSTSRRNAGKLIIVAVTLSIAFLGFVRSGWVVEAASSGPSPSHTDAPGEDNCTSCHVSYPVNSGSGSVVISGLPHDYLPGEQYPVSVTVSDPFGVIWGFQLTAIDSLGSRAGVFTIPPPPADRLQILSSFVNSSPRDYVEHTSNGTMPTVFGSNTWDFTWTAPQTRVGRISFFAAGNAANSNASPFGDYIYTTSTGTLSGSATANFDDDLASDIAYFRPSTATWYSVNIATGASQSVQFGTGADRVVAGDYDGDGTTDRALFRPSTAEWRIYRSLTDDEVLVAWGQPGDLPVPGDYDGDRRADQAVFRPTTGEWLINASTAGSLTYTLGQSGDKPVQGDYDGDAKTDIGVFRPSNATWYIVRSTAGPFQVVDGAAADQPVPTDYDGDGRADIARFRPSTATWYLTLSRDGGVIIQFGLPFDRPVAADYDGDGLADLAVFSAARKRVAPAWRIRRSSTQTVYDLVAGQPRDRAVASSYFPQ